MSAHLCWDNLVVSPGSTLLRNNGMTSHTYDPAYPPENMYNDDPSEVMAATAINSGADVTTYVRVQHYHNNEAIDRQIRVIAALNVMFSDLAAIADLRVIAIYAGGYGNFSLYFGTAQLKKIPGTENRYNIVGVLPAGTIGQHIELQWTSKAGSILNYEIGCLRAYNSLVLPDGIADDWRWGTHDPSSVARKTGSALVAQKRPILRTLEAPISGMTAEQAFGPDDDDSVPSFYKFAMEAGRSSPVLVIPRDDTVQSLQQTSLFGALNTEPALPHRGGDYFDSHLSLTEIRG